MSFEALFGQLTVNERGLNRNLNFNSEIRNGGIHLGYNFGHFLPENRTITPVLNIGITGFEFLSKSDLLDAEGRRYHYWNDGTIRDIPQEDPNSSAAVLLDRDYSYESDLRELNLDDIGDYNERSFSVPIGLMAQVKITRHFKFEFGSRLYFTGSDLIDNITDESIGDRAGNSSNDNFLYTSFGLNYGLHRKVESYDSDIIDAEFLAGVTDKADEDGDGVIDMVDQCPRTPADVKVKKNGCPVDGDNDGVPDYLDQELNTVKGAVVNAEGVTMSDEFFENRHSDFINGNAVNVVEETVESAAVPVPVFTPRVGKKYMVQVGDVQENISKEMANSLLSMPDVQTIEQGSTTLYMVGDYSNLPDAVKRKLSLESEGISGSVVRSENGQVVDVSDEAAVLNSGVSGTSMSTDNGTLWRVQIGAFNKKMPSTLFSSMDDIIVIEGQDGLVRYFSGVYDNEQDANEYKDILKNSGFNDAFLAAFENGTKKPVQAAVDSATGVNSYEELWSRTTPDGFDEAKVTYKIKLAESDGYLDPEKLIQFLELGSVEQKKDRGRTYYLIGKFDSMAEGKSSLSDYHNAGLSEAEVVGEFNGKVLSESDIQEMLKN